MIEWLNSNGIFWAELFGLKVLQDTIFLGIIFLVLYLLRNTDARKRYFIALIGLVKVILPPFMPAPFLKGLLSFSNEMFEVEIKPIAMDISATEIEIGESIDIIGLLFMVWVFTGAISFLITMIATFRLKLKLGDAKEIDINKLGYKSNGVPIKVFKTEKISMPLTVGAFSNKIFVPAQWDKWSEECKEMVIYHEMAHIKRRDGFVQFFQIFAQALYFFHPLIWILNTRINQYREMACDDMSMSFINKVSHVEYSRYLVKIAEDMTMSELGCSSASALIRQRNELLNRVQYQIMEVNKMKLSKKIMRLVFGSLLLLIVPLSWSFSSYEPAETSEPSKIIEMEKPGKIWGQVTNGYTGNPLVGVNIFLKGTEFHVRTDQEGRYYVISVPPENYFLKVEKVGYKTVVIKDVAVKSLKSTKVDIKLAPVVTKLGDGKIPPPPPPPPLGKVDGEEVEFVPYDTPPKPIGGFGVIKKNLKYPEKARKAGLSGFVVANLLVNKKGEITKIKIQKSLSPECDKAAIKALKSVEWKPAMNGEDPVDLWVAVPLKFALDGGSKSSKELPPPPPLIGEREIKKIAYDTPPEVVGGIGQVGKHLVYPEKARKAGLEGEVEIIAYISKKGKLTEAFVEISLNPECDKAAVKALKSVKWKPALKDNKPVSAWVTVPIKFKLR